MLSPKQVAQALGVSESSLKRWCDQGRIATTRTAGGHRRLELGAVLEFLRSTPEPLVRPEVLGLSAGPPRAADNLARSCQQMADALLIGDENCCRQIVLDLHLAGRRFSEICDQVLAAAFQSIGQRWSCGQAEVYQERRACEICAHVLFEFRRWLPAPPAQGPVAIGGSPEEDPYNLPSIMVEVLLRQQGWNATSLGSRLPLPSLAAAVRRERPRLVWLSVSHLADAMKFLADYDAFYRSLPARTAVVIGGRSLTTELQRQMKFTACCTSLGDLEAWLGTLTTATRRAVGSKSSLPKRAQRRVRPSGVRRRFEK